MLDLQGGWMVAQFEIIVGGNPPEITMASNPRMSQHLLPKQKKLERTRPGIHWDSMVLA